QLEVSRDEARTLLCVEHDPAAPARDAVTHGRRRGQAAVGDERTGLAALDPGAPAALRGVAVAGVRPAARNPEQRQQPREAPPRTGPWCLHDHEATMTSLEPGGKIRNEHRMAQGSTSRYDSDNNGPF